MRTFLAAAILLLVPSFLCAQSLGEVAAREKARRDKVAQGKPTKVITESELGGKLSSGTVSHPQASDVATAPAEAKKDAPKAGEAAGGEKKEKTEDELRAERVQDWRDRMQRAREDVSRLQSRVDEIQGSLGVPAPAYGSRGTAVNQLDQAKRELATAQQQVSQLEEEGRRNGFR